MKMTKRHGEVRLLDGNRAAAHGVRLCRPDVIAAYPITPQTALIEELYRFEADGLLDAELVAPEGENSALSILIGASAAGGRTFTATSSQGLSFMFDCLLLAAGDRVPIIMVIAMREQPSPQGVVAGQQDAISVKDTGWIQIYTESCQDILDSIIMAYRLAEDSEILLPVNVCYEGFYLSYLAQRVEIPEQEDVDRFLAPLQKCERPKLCLENPLTFSSYVLDGELYTEYRYKHCAAFERAKKKFDEIDKEFDTAFGRSYGGQIEEYKSDDADVVVVTMGSCTGTAKGVIDRERERGLKVGLIKIRMFRPFPRERLAKALSGKKAIAVVDRNVCYGWSSGHVFLEVKALSDELQSPLPRMLNFIGGLGGSDITAEHFERVIETAFSAVEGRPHKTVTWLLLE